MITLTTDFGYGMYTAEMKGVIYSINPDERVVDVEHNVSRHNIAEGAFILSKICRHYPPKTVHVAVVDPGVGGPRKAVAVETDRCFFVTPDNGLLTLALDEHHVKKIVSLDVRRVREKAGLPPEYSKVFHGRDLFAPAAALISMGVAPEELGSRVEGLVTIKFRKESAVYVDHFGNIVTNIKRHFKPGQKLIVESASRMIRARFVESYRDAEDGEIIVLLGSRDYIEVAVNKGNAAEKLKIKAGDGIVIKDAG